MFLAGNNVKANAKKFASSKVGSGKKIYFTLLFVLLLIVSKVFQ